MDWNWQEAGAVIASLATGAAGALGLNRARSESKPKGVGGEDQDMATVLEQIRDDSKTIQQTLSRMESQQRKSSESDRRALEAIRDDLREVLSASQTALESTSKDFRNALDRLITHMLDRGNGGSR